jgi:hypothetical protein
MHVLIAAMPDAKQNPYSAFYSDASAISSAPRVGFCVRAYS